MVLDFYTCFSRVNTRTLCNMLCFLRVCVLVFLVVSCRADCYFEQLQVGLLPGNGEISPPKGCVDSEGVSHDFGSEWVTAACYNCACTTSGISCCNKIPTAIQLPKECRLVVDKTTCSYSIALASDPTKPCLPN